MQKVDEEQPSAVPSGQPLKDRLSDAAPPEEREVEEVHGFDYDIGGKFYDWDY